jgi:hypothetical protein
VSHFIFSKVTIHIIFLLLANIRSIQHFWMTSEKKISTKRDNINILQYNKYRIQNEIIKAYFFNSFAL